MKGLEDLSQIDGYDFIKSDTFKASQSLPIKQTHNPHNEGKKIKEGRELLGRVTKKSREKVVWGREKEHQREKKKPNHGSSILKLYGLL